MIDDKTNLLKSVARIALSDGEGWEWSERGSCYRRRYGGDWQTWNPLEDDGDALRLAVQLRLDILFSPDIVEVFANTDADIEPSWSGYYMDDPYAATRKTIVKVAAKLGNQ